MPTTTGATDVRFFDEAAYLSQIQDEAYAREATVFATAHCPANRFLLAASSTGKVCVWDLNAYLFPSSGAPPKTPAATSLLLQGFFCRELDTYQGRLYPASLRRQGWPCLSLRVSRRAINSLVFLGKETKSPVLVLAGDDGIYTWPWKTVLKLLQQVSNDDEEEEAEDNDATPVVSLGPPSSLLKALPSQKAWPFLTESNQVTPATAQGAARQLYSACGDSLVRLWDVEKEVCAQVLVGHTGYVHAVKSLGTETTAPGLLVSGAEDGKVGLWDVRGGGGETQVQLLEGWDEGGGTAGSAAALVPPAGRSSWVAALDVDRGGNFLVAGGGVEGAAAGGVGLNKFGFVSVFHLPSFSLISSSTVDSFVQDLCFYNEKLISSGNESQVTHWSRPGLDAAARVTTDIASVFSINARDGPPYGDGVTVYAGHADHLNVFVNPESCAFNLKFR